jgi:hypothetical protein
MSLADWSEYFVLNAFAAVAISLDAALMILLRFRSLRSRRNALLWAGAVAATHVTFPMLGFVGGWYLVSRYRMETAVYGVGVVALIVLLRHLLAEATESGHEEHRALDIRIGSWAGFWVPVLVVSLDALLSGPGKVVMLDRYSDTLAMVSFLIVGLLVGAFTLTAGLIAWEIQRLGVGHYPSPGRLLTTARVGVFAELALFSFFLAWTFGKLLVVGWGASPGLASWGLALPAGLSLALALFWWNRRNIESAQRGIVAASLDPPVGLA